MQSKIERLPLAVGWMLIFVAVFAHMPALKGYFAQDDWSFLARGAGEVALDGWIARPFGSFLYWRLLWPLFGADSPGYHGTALLWAALLGLMTARVGLRIGLRRLGASVAGLVVAASPLPLIPIFWVSASQELMAVLFALLAVDLWLAGGRWRWLSWLAALLSFASKESALGLAPWLYLLAFLRVRSVPARERLQLLGMAGLAAVFAGTILRSIPHGAGDPYELGGAVALASNLGRFGSWLISPALLHGSAPFLFALGGLVWAGWFGVALLFLRRRGESLPLLALLWSLLSLAPVLLLRNHLYPYYLCGALIGWAWFLGWLAERALPASWQDGRAGNAPAMAWVAACVFVAIFSWSSAQNYLKARGDDGMPLDPIVRRSWIAAELKKTIGLLPLSTGGHLTVLQATRVDAPEGAEGEILLGSPVFLAMQGPIGLARIVPDGVDIEWATHLDTTPRQAQVLLDDGAPFLRPLGDAANARVYSALIAIAAGQYSRARHDLWNVVGPLGSQVRWAYDSDALPIDAAALRSNARGFASYLAEEATPADGRILRIFEQMYEAVTGEELIGAPWGGPIKG